MQPKVMPTEHLAGPMLDLVQRCTRCSEILMDYRGPGAEEMVRRRGPENPPRGWQEGAGVVLHGHRSDLPGSRLRGSLAEVYDGEAADGGPAVKCTAAAAAA